MNRHIDAIKLAKPGLGVTGWILLAWVWLYNTILLYAQNPGDHAATSTMYTIN